MKQSWIRRDYLTDRWVRVKDPGFLLTNPSTACWAKLFYHLRQWKNFHICSCFKASRQKKLWIPDFYKALVHTPVGTVTVVHISHHPTSVKWERKPHFCLSLSKAALALISIPVCLHCAAAETTCYQSKTWHGSQMGMCGKMGGIQ